MNQNTTFVCPACDVATSSTSKLHCHLERHLGQRPFSCRLCPKKYVLKFEANRHIKEKHLRDDVDAIRIEDPNSEDNPVVSIECLRCRATIRCREDLKHHALIHSGVCSLNDDSDRRPADRDERNRRKMHIREVANIRRVVATRWKCIVCAQTQPDLTEMTLHLNEHVHCLTFVCEGCGASFDTRSQVIRHLVETNEDGVNIRVEQGAEPVDCVKFKCKCCEDEIETISTLRTHIQQHYTNTDNDLAAFKSFWG